MTFLTLWFSGALKAKYPLFSDQSQVKIPVIKVNLLMQINFLLVSIIVLYNEYDKKRNDGESLTALIFESYLWENIL